MVRPDEEFVRGAVGDFLKEQGQDCEIREGPNPPDFVVDIGGGGRLTALEVTRGVALYESETGAANRRTVDQALLDVCDDLEQRFSDRIPANHTILLHLKGPVANFRKFKRNLGRAAEGLLDRGLDAASPDWFDLIDSARAKVLRAGSPGRKSICCIVQNSSPIMDIQFHTELIVLDRIGEKERILDKIPWDGPRWLAILNNYTLATLENYQTAVRANSHTHGFERVFLVSSQRQVLCVP